MLTLAFFACAPSIPSVKPDTNGDPWTQPDDTGDSGLPDDTGDTDDTADTADSAVDTATCDDISPLPVSTTYVKGIQNSEDFTFDLEGNLININQRGALVKQSRTEDTEIILPNVGSSAGIRMLPNGDVAFNNVGTNTIDRITMAGERSLILGGLNYPNGLALGMDGWLYVAENGAGRVRRVDPETGDNEILAEGLYQPNGVAFAHDFNTLYVGSFGGGVVYALDRNEDESFGKARIYGTTPEAPGVPKDDCYDLSLGDACFISGTGGVGTCEDHDGTSLCTVTRDTAACTDKVVGDACVTELLGETLDSSCIDTAGTGEVYCSRVATERMDACATAGLYGICEYGGVEGYCYPEWEGGLACINNNEANDMYTADCHTRAVNDACVVENPAGPDTGVCTDYSAYGYPDLYCVPAWYGSGGGHGGLDAISADACGNVYASEYTIGKIWRFASEGAEAEEVVQLNSGWIPNMHFGLGVGGWEKNELYVMNLDRPGVYALEVGVEGTPDAYATLAAP